MKEITILSGKGGTGKTSIAAAIASVSDNAVFCDSDVDAADLHILLDPEVEETHTFYGAWGASINQEKCMNCGLCELYCRFEAIHKIVGKGFEINPFQCEGCRLCERVCPVGAITSEKNNNNFWYVSNTRFGKFVHAKMGPGEENSGKLVTRVRNKANEIAKSTKADFIINDGPPGIGCSAIASLSGSDAVLLVIEPTMSGLHDAKRLVELVNSFGIPMYAVVNKFDINANVSTSIEAFLKKESIPLITKIPFGHEMVEAMVERKTVIEYLPTSPISNKITEAWQSLKKLVLEQPITKPVNINN